MNPMGTTLYFITQNCGYTVRGWEGIEEGDYYTVYMSLPVETEIQNRHWMHCLSALLTVVANLPWQYKSLIQGPKDGGRVYIIHQT